MLHDLKEIKKTILGEEIEHKIRYALGQRLTTFTAGKKPEHLRFEMAGDRDDDTGYYMNLSVFGYFNFPLYLDLSYNNKNIVIQKSFDHSFVFHKGTGTLYKKGKEVASFGGYGTIDILILLVYYFGDFDNFVKNR
jgi:hypothetical protein